MIKKLLLLSFFFLSVSTVVAQNNYKKVDNVSQTSLAEVVSIYPNPAIDKVQISNDSDSKLKVEIYNILGDSMLSKSITGNDDYIDITRLQAGIYIVSFTDGKRTTTKRLVKN
ncbi:T9SS type A sorting domain-containing protein [Dokdonia sp. Asnod3-C12]|uniref:T9SS type A sorting domain-containing protein n=1 Tax=Dokdonia sp. Asnod3-C12 TaxID=3160575 RepID=UPI00386B0514